MKRELEPMETRQERREKKLRKKKEQIPQHGKALAKIYKNAVQKRATKKQP
ncbi:MAG: hypothetical protein Q7R50_00365 [Dehalococcoidales bacterium]|nr:hypothetical protein [Dehalococcoidales bacterium]